MKNKKSHVFFTLAFSIILYPQTALAESGGPWYRNFTLDTGITMVTQNTMGNDVEGSKDAVDFSFTADMIFTGNIDEEQSLVFVMEAGDGHTANDDISGNRAVPNYDGYITAADGMTRLNISQAYYQNVMGEGKFTFAVGKMDVHALTDTNQFAGNETEQFLNNLFVRSTGVVFHELSGYYAPTIYVEFKPLEFFSLSATYSSADGYDIVDRRHVDFQLTLHTQIGEGTGNYRFGIMMDNGEYTKIGEAAPAAGADAPILPVKTATNTGFYASLDQGFGSTFGAFFRFAQQDDAFIQNEVISAISGGISLNNLMGNEGNSVGLGYGLLEINEKVVTQYYEGMDVLELYVRFGVSESARITLDFQMLNDLERGSKRSVMLGGLRFQTRL